MYVQTSNNVNKTLKIKISEILEVGPIKGLALTPVICCALGLPVYSIP